MKSEIIAAIDQICAEKNIPREAVLATIEAALAAAYRKDFGEKNQNIRVEFNADTGGSRVFDVKTVVEDMELDEFGRVVQRDAEGNIIPFAEDAAVGSAASAVGAPLSSSVASAKEDAAPAPAVAPENSTGKEGEVIASASPEEALPVKRFNPKTEIMLAEARKIKPDAAIGEEIRTELPVPSEYGRMAAQTAKQVIIQRLREVERETIFQEFKDKEGKLITGMVTRQEGRFILIDIGHTNGVIPPEEQIEGELLAPGSRVKVYVVRVAAGPKGADVILSRTHADMVKLLFAQEVPEIGNGSVEVKAIAREGGSRTKIAVASNVPNVDPVGSCVGQRGTRVQTIIQELGGEKVDIIAWSPDQRQFVLNALSPAKVISLQLDSDRHVATAAVAEDQLSLAIGRGGQNVRLAARLTGWKIDIIGEGREEAASASAEAATDKSVEVAATEVGGPAVDAAVVESGTEVKATLEATVTEQAAGEETKTGE